MAETMKRVFAILQEPASYTVDRNRSVYDKLGIGYCYITGNSEAKSDQVQTDCLSDLNDKDLRARLKDILSNYDVVIINGYVGKVFRYLYILNKRYKKIIGIDSDTQLRIPKNPIKRIAKDIYLRHIFKNKLFYGLAGGTGTHKELFRHYGMPEDHIVLMPMMINNELFYNVEKKGSSKFTFIYVGRIIGLKNLPTMLESFIHAFGERKDVELRLIGQGDQLNYLRSKYSTYKNIVFVGAKFGKDLATEYQNSSAFILPSSSEQWGLVVNEAMAAGLPVIVSDQVGAAHDLVEGRDTGFIFPYQDVDKLSECMRNLVDDRAVYEKYSANAASFMKNYWNYDLYTKCLLDFINKASSAK